ncbi:MAG TPA: cobalt ECF transporter T component CbiQ [Dissulfurispiraceae bacterium]|nr:cobalt ECF transporter T component CbiQ [Dissulfurispiraceae bacterium]
MEIFSEYFKKEHLLSRIDARIKLLVAVAMLAFVLSYKGFTFPLIVFVLGIGLCIMMKIPPRVLALRFSEPLFIACVVIMLKFLFSGKDVMFSFSILGFHMAGHKDGLADGLMIACRIAGAVSVVAVLGFSTPFTELIAGLSWMKVPKGFIEILLFAYRYLFMLLEDAIVIYNAQKNRLGYSSIRRGLGSFGTLAGTLTLKAFENSQNITVAMLQRGYDGNMPTLKHEPFRTSDVACSIIFIILMGVVWKM